MIRTETEIQDIFLGLANESGGIGGVRYYDKKPCGESLAGVVEVSDCATYGETQSGYVYVLIYVPDINVGGEQTKDRAKIRMLERSSVERLARGCVGDYVYEFVGQSCSAYMGGAMHVISNRLFIKLNTE